MWKQTLVIGLAGLLLAWPAAGQAPPPAAKKPTASKPEKKEEKKPEKRETYRYLGQLTGTLKDVSESARSITLEITGATPTFIPTHYWRGMIRGTYQFNQQIQDIDILLADDVKVRMPIKYERDEKGKVKPIKPDPDDHDRHYGGVKGTESDLARRQIVTVHLGMTTSDPRNQRIVATVVIVLKDVPGR
jgi:hypothetical protein